MKNRYPIQLLLAILLCTPAVSFPGISLGDAACVAVPVVLGALAGREIAQDAIRKEKKDKEAKESVVKKYRDKSSAIDNEKTALEAFKEILVLARDPKDIDLGKVALLNQQVSDVDQNILGIEQQLKKARDHRLALELMKNIPDRFGGINIININQDHLDKAINNGEQMLKNTYCFKRIFESARDKKDLASCDLAFLDHCIDDQNKQCEAIDKKLAKTNQKFLRAQKELQDFNPTLVSDEASVLRNGTLIGGAVGGGAGLLMLGVTKYLSYLDEQDKQRQQEQHEQNPRINETPIKSQASESANSVKLCRKKFVVHHARRPKLWRTGLGGSSSRSSNCAHRSDNGPISSSGTNSAQVKTGQTHMHNDVPLVIIDQNAGTVVVTSMSQILRATCAHADQNNSASSTLRIEEVKNGDQ